MLDKRLFKKLTHIRGDISPPFIYGGNKPETVLVGWGSTYGILKEAVDVLSEKKNIAMLHFSEIYPFPSPRGRGKFNYMDILHNARQTICIENNATAQFARLMRTETGYEFRININRYDGRPFTLETLIGEINAHITGL